MNSFYLNLFFSLIHLVCIFVNEQADQKRVTDTFINFLINKIYLFIKSNIF